MQKYIKYLSTQLGYSEDIIYYVITITMRLIIYLGIYAIVAYILGVFVDYLICLLLFALLRSFAGGVHLKSSISCFFSTLCILIIPIYITYNIKIPEVYLLLIYLISVLLLFKYAPIGVSYNKVYGNERYRKMRKHLLLLLFLFTLSVCVMPYKFILLLVTITFIVTLMVTPFMYKLLRIERG